MKDADGLYQRLGIAIRAARLSNKLSLEQMAQLGILSKASLSGVERGKQRVPIAVLVRIGKALGVPGHRLLKEAEENQS